MIATFTKAFRLLSSDVEPYQLSLGISLGIVAGLSPLLTVQTLSVLLLIISLRVNISMFMLSFGLVSVIAYLADPLIVMLGQQVLAIESLNELFTQMYNNGLWRFLNFNNTAAMGSLVISLIIFLPVFFVFLLLIKKYRDVIERHLKNSRMFRWASQSKLLGKVAAITDKAS